MSSSHTPQRSRRVMLPRGGACMDCRRKKMRCDGARPFCGNCSRTMRPHDCEYADHQGRTRVEILEEQLTRLQERITELENPGAAQEPVLLHQPQVPSRSPSRTRGQRGRTLSRGTSGQRGLSTSAPSVQNVDLWPPSEFPPPHFAEPLVEVFLAHADQLLFVLKPTRVRNTCSLPMDHPERPHSVLLNVVILWALRLSRLPSLTKLEAIYIDKTLADLPDALRSMDTRTHIFTMQAEVLLALYFYNLGRVIEGRYHTDAAVSIAKLLRLHKIGSAQPAWAGLGALSPPPSSPSPTQLDEGEKINAFWSVFILDKCWSVALGISSVLQDESSVEGAITTPWPVDLTDNQDILGFSQETSGGNTVLSYVNQPAGSTATITETSLSLRAKASALFERATRMGEKYAIGQVRGEDYRTLHERIKRFIEYLESLNLWTEVAVDKRRSYVVVFCLTLASMIQLHSPFASIDPGSRGVCSKASKEVLGLVARLSLDDLPFMDPIIGTAWVNASRFLADEPRSGASGQGQYSTLPLELGKPTASIMVRRLVVIMDTWAENSPLLGKQVDTVKEMWSFD